MALAEKKITALHRATTVLSEKKEALEVQSARLWGTFKGVELYHSAGKNYLLPPEGWTITHGGTLGKQEVLENGEEISHDRTGMHAQKCLLIPDGILDDTQKAHNTSLVNHQCSLESYAQAIRQLQEKIGQLQTERQKSTRHLQRLSDIHTSLEPLLSRLSALLNAQ